MKHWLIRHNNKSTVDQQRLLLMSAIVEAWKKNPDLRLWTMQQLGSVDPPRKYYDFVVSKQIHEALSALPFRKDIVQVETLQTPDITLQVSGDCDDLSILTAATLQSVGVPTKWIISKQGSANNYNHVATFLPSIGAVFDLTHPLKKYPLPVTDFREAKIL